ncbi:MAG: transcriptional regulator [Halobacteriaceae archaeon]
MPDDADRADGGDGDVDGDERTTRERLRDRIEDHPATPTALADALDVHPDAALEHARHVARSVRGEADAEFLVRPPECVDCGFDGFDDPLNRPSRCPECRSERIREPAFTVEAE